MAFEHGANSEADAPVPRIILRGSMELFEKGLSDQVVSS
jgi:hypothetical protein